MDPYDEQRLRDEVIYLHSLWHQGPARPPPTNPSLQQLQNPPQFKRDRLEPGGGKKGKKGKKRHKRNQENEPTVSILDSGKEWPCNPTSSTSPATTSSGWPAENFQPKTRNLLLSPQEVARFAANRAQVKALNVAKEFFRSKNSDDDEIEEDEDDDLMEKEDACEEYRFFFKLLMEDGELRDYYQKNYQNGDFSCLVCGALGKKNAGKKFKDCVALVQHSMSIARTNKRQAHRAYGQVICKVLGWDIDRLPTIISELSEKVSKSLNNSGMDEVGAQVTYAVAIDRLPTEEVDISGKNSGVAEVAAQLNDGDETEDSPNVLDSNEAPGTVSNGEETREKESASSESLSKNDESVFLEGNDRDETKDSLNVLDNNEAPGNVSNGEETREKESVSSENLSKNDKSVDLEEVCSWLGVAGNDCDETKDGPNVLDNNEALGNVSNGEETGEKESIRSENLAKTDESVALEDSLTAADASRCAEDFSLTVPKMVECEDSGQPTHVESSKENNVVADKGKDAIPDEQESPKEDKVVGDEEKMLFLMTRYNVIFQVYNEHLMHEALDRDEKRWCL